MPLNPIIGNCNPSRPDVEVRIADGEVVGTATFTRRFVGPAGHAHGGISAMLADQLVAAAPMAIGVRTVTKSLTVRYLRALPARRGGRAVGRVHARRRAVQGQVRGARPRRGRGRGHRACSVPYKNLAKRAGITREGKESGRRVGDGS